MSGKTVLALEWSSRRLSVAAQNASGGVIQAHAESDRFRAPEAMVVLEEIVRQLGGLDEVGEIRIGRGPGNYSGIRQAFAVAAGMAAPGGMVVRAASSGYAQAKAFRKKVSEPVWILGDARRGMWWGRCFPDTDPEWQLAKPETWRERVGQARCLSGEAERLEGLPGLELAMPRAQDLLALTEQELNEPCRPLYLHPAVGTAPSGGADAIRGSG